MKRTGIISLRIIFFSVMCALFCTQAYAFAPTNFTINFGGNVGRFYTPSKITVEVGDTVIWKGDFSTYSLVSTSVPSGAQPIGPVNSGQSFQYVIEAAGTYLLENPQFAQTGMRDTVVAVFKSHGSINNEGREFYLGMLYPTYMYIASSTLFRELNFYAIITTYYDNVINYSYYDAGGNELPPTKKVMGAKERLQITLNQGSMRVDSFPEQNIYRAMHITSKYPISVQYLSRAANSGGSYLALPVMGVGKKYVIASYNDDAGNGALVNINGFPKTAEPAGGCFMIIATDNTTTVGITPTVKTSGGKSKGVPFTVGLSKGQCYFVRSDGKSADNDISGTVIESNKPIVVISGHEDAYIGDVSGSATEGRDMMIEQMIPVEYWDSVGYIGIPMVTSTGTASGGIGDGYRVYTYDQGQAKVQADVQGIGGGYDLSVSKFGIAEHYDITTPADIYATNGHKISVMQYDERSQPSKTPYSAPAMMTIIPHSRWRTAYNFSEFDPGGLSGVNPNQYVAIISDSMNSIRISVDGAAEVSIPTTGFVNKLTFSNLSKMFSSKGTQFDVASHTYSLRSDIPFICYTYGMSTTSLNFGMFGNYTFAYEYAAPAGMQLNTGVPPNFQVTVTTLPNCGGWNVCVKDLSPTNAGIKAVSFVDDPDGVYYKRPGTMFKNVSFEAASPDLFAGELHPDPQQNTGPDYCFVVKIDNRLEEATAPLGIIDKNNNGLLYRLHRSAPTVGLSTSPIVAPKPDSIFFPQQKVGVEVCTTFVVKNTASAGGSPLAFIGARIAHSDAAFSIKSITPTLPAQINAQQDLTIQLCYTAKDSLRHLDTLIVSNDCFDIRVSLDAHSSTGLITADDIAFGDLDTGKTVCKNITIKNTGSAPYTLLASPTLSDNVNFNIDPAFLSSLPLVMKAGDKKTVSVCFHPKTVAYDSASIVWLTDIDASFANSGKKYSSLTGTGLEVPIKGVRSSDDAGNSLMVRPNPATGSSAYISFNLPDKGKATVSVYDVLGREITHFNFNKGTDGFELPIAPFRAGLYYVRLTSGNVVLTQKLEVSH